MYDDLEPRQVSVAPIDLLKRSMDLMGDQYLLFTVITFVGMFIGNIVPIVLLGPMLCGIYFSFLRRARGETVTFEMLFRGFDYFLESLIAAIVAMAAQAVVIIPAYLIIIGGIVGAFAGGGGLISILAVLVSVVGYFLILLLSVLIPAFLVFVPALIVDRQMTAIPAIKLSIKAVSTNLIGVLTMSIVYAVISFAASCACLIPAFFFAPIAIGATAILYQDIFDGTKHAE